MAYRLSSRDVRRSNRAAILQSLYFDGETSRLELSQRTNLSTATVTNVVAELLTEQVLSEIGNVESRVGRPRTLLAIQSQQSFLIGVDIAEQQIKMGLFDLLLMPISEHVATMDSDLRQPEHVVEHIARGIPILLGQAKIDPQRVLGVGVGVPGTVEVGSQVVVHAPSVGWEAVPIKALLEQLIPFPIFLDNGGKTMTQAEMLVKGGHRARQFAVVSVGTGVGGGIVTDGTLLRGATNSAGELGHMKIELDGRACRCGSAGCLEAYVGAWAILDRLRERDPEHAALGFTHAQDAIGALIDATRLGNAVAIEVLDETVRYLGAGIANLVNLFNPELVLLGGWMGQQIGSLILPELTRQVQRYSLASPYKSVTIALSHQQPDVVVQGPATLVLEQFLASGGDMQLRTQREGIFA